MARGAEGEGTRLEESDAAMNLNEILGIEIRQDWAAPEYCGVHKHAICRFFRRDLGNERVWCGLFGDDLHGDAGDQSVSRPRRCRSCIESSKTRQENKWLEDLRIENERLQAALTRVLEVLRKVEWLDENKHVSTCPVCGGITPKLKDWVGTTGHTPDCALAALKREIEGL